MLGFSISYLFQSCSLGIRCNHPTSWFDFNYQVISRTIRQAEWDCGECIRLVRKKHSFFHDKGHCYWENKSRVIQQTAGNWKDMSTLLGLSCKSQNPSFTAEDFLCYMTKKIHDVCNETEVSCTHQCHLDRFEIVNCKETKWFILSSQSETLYLILCQPLSLRIH